MSDKIQPRHLQRLALIYVRQSSPKQIRNNKESRKRQRALAKRASQLGWTDEKILVLEEEARSASSTADRTTYRKASELVCQYQVGIILAVEVSRWSRDSVALQLLLRDCVYGNVLLGDEHSIYDADDPHDNASLGIQGVLAEYELRMIRKRMLECWWEKAERGEVVSAIGTGYVAIPGKGLQKHPNARVRNSLDHMFHKFNEMPSVLKLWQWYYDHNKLLPYVEHGDDPHNVQWLPANYKRMLRMLKNPVYAGAYVIGRTETFVRRTHEGEMVRRRRTLSPDQWKVVEKDSHPAYISWEQYQRNLTSIRGNSRMNGEPLQEAPRRGAALLSGLLRCARCSHRLQVQYDSSGRIRYVCRGGGRQRESGKQCLSFSSRYVDPMFSETMLDVVRPAGIEAAGRAAQLCREDYEAERQSLLDELTQFEYEAERAQRQYDRVEPENRLVAAELEARWNDALAALTDARTRLERFEGQSQPAPSEEQIQQLTSLGQRLERVWFREDTDAAIKKQIASLLVREVIAEVNIQRNEVTLWIQWTGGHHTELVAPRGGRTGHSASVEAKEVIGTLRAVCDDAGIAHALNRNGVRCGSKRWTAAKVRSFRERGGIKPFDKAEKESLGLLSQEEAAQKLGISPMSVHRLVQSGILAVEQPSPGLPSIIREAELGMPEVQQAVRQIRSNLPRPLPADPNQQKLF